jgi:hypothetical protein
MQMGQASNRYFNIPQQPRVNYFGEERRAEEHRPPVAAAESSVNNF